jgi:hypothetical protein
MKRSRAVQAFLVVSAAGALISCGQRHEAVRRCVDENGNYSDNGKCSSTGTGIAGHHYTWVYAPSGSANASPETTTTTTTSTTASGSKAASSEGTSRGVVGAEGAAHAGGEGGHAGGGGGE